MYVDLHNGLYDAFLNGQYRFNFSCTELDMHAPGQNQMKTASSAVSDTPL